MEDKILQEELRRIFEEVIVNSAPEGTWDDEVGQQILEDAWTFFQHDVQIYQKYFKQGGNHDGYPPAVKESVR